jgi:hypothetical protein
MEGCTISGAVGTRFGTHVIRDSTVQIALVDGTEGDAGDVYLVDNTYRTDLSSEGNEFDVWIRTGSKATTYILGRGSDRVRLGLRAGNCAAEGVDLQAPVVASFEPAGISYGRDDYSYLIWGHVGKESTAYGRGSLLLRDATVYGGYWEDAYLAHSVFHTVALHPVMHMLHREQTAEMRVLQGALPPDPGKLSVFKVSEPEGSPWLGEEGEAGKAPQTRPGGANRTPVRVPTLEELGLAGLRDMR